MKRISRVTTKTGDNGETTLGNGAKIAKSSARIQALGAVDELNAQLGLLKLQATEFSAAIENIQHRLFDIGGDISLPEQSFFNGEHLDSLSDDCTTLNQQLPPLTEFVIPGEDMASAQAHIARTVCRRAESVLWCVIEEDSQFNLDCARYLNRLSDWLFIVARLLARKTNGGQETQWEK